MPDVSGNQTPRFIISADMPMKTRIKWIIGLILTGVILQTFASVFLGWVLILVGCLMGLISGKSVTPSASGAQSWQNTTLDELENIEKLSEKISQWRRNMGIFSGAGMGCVMVFASLIGILLVTAFIMIAVDGQDLFNLPPGAFGPPLRGGLVSPIWVLDSLTMLIVPWLSGSVNVWEPSQLNDKALYLLNIYHLYRSDPDLEFVPSLYVTQSGDRSFPTDCRMLVKIKSAPEDFIGIQIQISMNNVQGQKYPYCYSVIIAKKAFGLKSKASQGLEPPDTGGWMGLGLLLKDSNTKKEAAFSRFDESVTEVESESDVDVVVVRQVTSGTGYHTSEAQAAEVFQDALNLAKLILKSPVH